MTRLHAQPYNISVSGFYFESSEEYRCKANNLKDDFGQPIEEFEIQMIDADSIDIDLFNALGIHQGNIGAYFDACEIWENHQKINVIIAVGEVGYGFDCEKNDPDDFDIDLYEMDSLRDLAYHFVDEGLFGEIPETIQSYVDYDAIARDLGMDYSEISINGTNYIYRCD